MRPTPEDLVPTIGWEAVREGIDDHRYLTTLSKLIQRARAKGLSSDSKRARAVLQEWNARIDTNGHQARAERGLATKRRLGNHYDRSTGPGQEAAVDYESFRRQLAGEILRLQRALSGASK